MDHPTLIRKLGGPAKLGDKLRDREVKVEDVTVRSWMLPGRSIPAKYWTHIAEIARAEKVPVSFEAMARAVAA